MAGRRLNPEERAVWSRVVASVRRAAGVLPVIEATPDAPPHKLTCVKAKAPVVAPAPKPARPPVPVAIKAGVTLDGSWDRRIASGGAAPERTVDLHGCGVDQAHRRLLRELDLALADEIRVLLVVTGKAPKSDASRIDLPLRGIIRASIHDWVAASRHAGQIAAIRPAHPKHGGAGALYLILRRSKMGAVARQY
ncbi:DNA mismatch repair protein MutS [Sphingomonas paeninsulae]|uniref:DNA mismatch repair protein MutS n=1 Tax=Sphingomonas paeninsulae TaxID=2319844 RepID=A0A494TJE9_SPHPE|nr:Smr/MutS family protein [Sphingomonas paeninsulae]AYJ85901.1 DNA mismatch repair protein MutS [Sphingomonas paeninsulae]